MNEWTLYWITRLDGIVSTANFFAVGLGIFVVLGAVLTLAIYVFGNDDEIKKRAGKAWVGLFLVFAFFDIGCTYIPNTRDALIIYGVPKLLQSQAGAIKQAGEIPEKSLKLLNQYLDEQLKKETQPND